jgi:septum formation inhibitor-activating ATPase MinD
LFTEAARLLRATDREMLSNTVAFWMVRKLANKNWDASAIDIPAGISGYLALRLK